MAHRRSDYPLLGCVPAEPSAVSSDGRDRFRGTLHLTSFATRQHQVIRPKMQRGKMRIAGREFEYLGEAKNYCFPRRQLLDMLYIVKLSGYAIHIRASPKAVWLTWCWKATMRSFFHWTASYRHHLLALSVLEAFDGGVAGVACGPLDRRRTHGLSMARLGHVPRLGADVDFDGHLHAAPSRQQKSPALVVAWPRLAAVSAKCTLSSDGMSWSGPPA